jgi:ribonuclease R
LKIKKMKEKKRGKKREKIKEKKQKKLSSARGILAEGMFTGHRKGFGFVTVEGMEGDVFIPESDTGTALHQDRVQILLRESKNDTGRESKKRQEGVVVKVLERGMPQIVGTFETGQGYGFVICDNSKFSKDVFISKKDSKGVRDGDKVIVEITDYGSKNKNPQGKVIENLGSERAPGTDILAIVKSYGIPTEFPPKVLTQAERVPDHVLDADREGRLCLVELPTVTIDGEDAKDLDDAVSLTKEDGIYHLGVHIADVSNYVQGGSALDREALKRGTSVYLADRVIPMLPEKLSNGICSLNQGADRLTLSCLMDIDETGRVISHKIAESVIRVDERMSYTAVKEILEETNPELNERYRKFVPMFFQMQELSGLLRKSRHLRGAVDFSFTESKIILNGAGRAIDVQPYEANVATKIIEDFMLLANETVAEEYCTGEYPFVYRTHDNPDPDKVESLLSLLHSQGIAVQKSKESISPSEIQKLLESIEGQPNEAQISRLALRTMKQARYTTDCSGHFGLAARYYCHFTSPIRRYPDLQIHRIIRDNLRGRLAREGRTEHYREILEEVAQKSSACERRAEEAEREAEKMKKAEYMSYHLGEEFEGIVSGVTCWGLYVELPNTVEGLVHVNTLRDDYYIFDEENYELRGELTKKVYGMGQKVRVRVEDADASLRTIDFVLVEEREDKWQKNQESS